MESVTTGGEEHWKQKGHSNINVKVIYLSVSFSYSYLRNEEESKLFEDVKSRLVIKFQE